MPPPINPSPKIAIIGGGWAGFAAAVELSTGGVPVTLFEPSPNLGGRARGFTHKGLQLDNGQHILLGAYHETLRLMRQVGVDVNTALLRLPLRLETPGHLRLATPHLPAPLHLLTGLLGASGLSIRERFAAIGFMTRLRLGGFSVPHSQTVAELLAGQPEKLVRLLWEPLCLAALNTPISTACAQTFVNVLRDSLTQTRADSDLLLPRQDLSRLFPQAAARYLQDRAGVIRHATVSSVVPGKTQVQVNGETFDHVICATAPHNALKLLPELVDACSNIAALAYQPITTIYLQYSADTTLPFPMLGMTGGLGQWVFDRGTLCHQHGLLAVVISAQGAHSALTQDSLADTIHHELRTLLGNLPQPEWRQVITEKRATFACIAGLTRPAQQTSHPRLWLAGDYTAGEYPATLEAAVRSGVKCAQLVLSALS